MSDGKQDRQAAGFLVYHVQRSLDPTIGQSTPERAPTKQII